MTNLLSNLLSNLLLNCKKCYNFSRKVLLLFVLLYTFYSLSSIVSSYNKIYKICSNTEHKLHSQCLPQFKFTNKHFEFNFILYFSFTFLIFISELFLYSKKKKESILHISPIDDIVIDGDLYNINDIVIDGDLYNVKEHNYLPNISPLSLDDSHGFPSVTPINPPFKNSLPPIQENNFV